MFHTYGNSITDCQMFIVTLNRPFILFRIIFLENTYLLLHTYTLMLLCLHWKSWETVKSNYQRWPA